MKGVIFTEFLALIEHQFSPSVAEQVIERCALPSNGCYTAVGHYDFKELWSLVTSLSELSNTPESTLLKHYGERLAERFTDKFAFFFKESSTLFDFLDSVDRHIHQEVRKLYPNAELPRFSATRKTPSCLELRYVSNRCLGDFAEGLIKGVATYYQQTITIIRDRQITNQTEETTFTINLVP